MGKNSSKPVTSDGALRIKLLFFGDKGVGKTAIIDRFFTDEFSEDYEPTLGSILRSKELMFNSMAVKMYTSDSITEPDFAIESRAKSLKNAHVLVLIVDLAHQESFTRLE